MGAHGIMQIFHFAYEKWLSRKRDISWAGLRAVIAPWASPLGVFQVMIWTKACPSIMTIRGSERAAGTDNGLFMGFKAEYPEFSRSRALRHDRASNGHDTWTGFGPYHDLKDPQGASPRRYYRP